MKFFAFALIALILSFSPSLLAQEHEGKKHAGHNDDAGHEEEFLRHYVGFHVGHTHVSGGVKNGDKKWLALPSFGLGYIYGINRKWGIGVHTEMIVEDFVVKGSGNENTGGLKSSEGEIGVIERGRPIAVAVIGIYKVHKHIGLILGGGMEFSEHEDFGLVKIGAEFPYHFAPGWEMFGTLSADLKIDAYNSFSFGFGIAKLF